MSDSSKKEAKQSLEIARLWIEMLDRLREFRLEGRFTDFTICCESREIKAHKNVLASASAYFNSMFAHDTKESRENRMNMDDVKFEVLEVVIDYMYMSKIVIDEDNLEPVLRGAQYFQLDGLESICAQHMIDKLSSGNWLRYFLWAKDVKLNSLEQEAFRYALKNFKDVVDDEHFLEIDLDLFSCLLDSDDLEVEDEFEVIEAILKWTLGDEDVRTAFLPELIGLVRLTFIDPKKLAKLTCYKPIWESLECQRYLNGAKDYYHLKNTDTWKPPGDLAFRLNTKPRILGMQKRKSLWSTDSSNVRREFFIANNSIVTIPRGF